MQGTGRLGGGEPACHLGGGGAGTRAHVRAAVGGGPSQPAVLPVGHPVLLQALQGADRVRMMKRYPPCGLLVLKRQLGNQQLPRQHQAATPPHKGVSVTQQLPRGQSSHQAPPHGSTQASELSTGHVGLCGSWAPRALPPHLQLASPGRRPSRSLLRPRAINPCPVQPGSGLPTPSAPTEGPPAPRPPARAHQAQCPPTLCQRGIIQRR